MYQDNSDKAAEFLRQAVPLMVKHQIPPTPHNYALWYSYVSNRDPELKTAIDKTLAAHGTCPSSATSELFHEHIIAEQVAGGDAARDSLKAIISELRTHVDEALIDTEDFHRLLDSSNSSLQQESAEQDIGSLIGALISGTQQASDSTRMFRTRMIETQKEVEALREELKRTQQEAQRDPLTGLFNRRYFERYVNDFIESNQRTGKCVIMLDIDHFKSFNDSYGHLVGDKVIQRVGALLSKAAMAEDFAVRFGGEEFVLLMNRTDLKSAFTLAEKIRKLLQTIVLKDRKAEKDIRRITASFGIAQLLPSESKEEWIERADKALYRAKQEGRNRVVLAS